MINLFKTTTLILATLVFSVVVSGCIKKPVQQANVNQPVNQNVNVNQNTNTATSTADELDSVTGWKIYKNLKYGFQFEYPKNWSKEDVNGFDSDNNRPYIGVRFFDRVQYDNYGFFVWVIKIAANSNYDFLSVNGFERWYNENQKGNQIKNIFLVKFNKYIVFKVEAYDGIDSIGTYVYFYDKEKNLVIYFSTDMPENNTDLNKVFLSFSFIN